MRVLIEWWVGVCEYLDNVVVFESPGRVDNPGA